MELWNCFENGCLIKCGRTQQVWLCAHLLLVLGIAHLYTQVGFQNCCLSTCSLNKKKEKEWKQKENKKKEKKRKKRNKRSLDLSIVWEPYLEVLVCGITFMLDWDLFLIAPLFLLWISYLSICSTPCPQPHYNLEKSFWSWPACVFGLVVGARGLPSLLMFVFQGCFESEQ